MSVPLHLEKKLPPIRQKQFDPDEFEAAAKDWMERCVNEMVRVTIPKVNNVTGALIEMDKPKPPLIDTFCRDIGMTYDSFKNYASKSGYEAYFPVARALKEFCNATILEYAALGLIPEKIAMFYLVNNSRYKDVSEIVQTDVTKVLPAWAQGKTVEIRDKEAGQPGEYIEHEDIPINK